MVTIDPKRLPCGGCGRSSPGRVRRPADCEWCQLARYSPDSAVIVAIMTRAGVRSAGVIPVPAGPPDPRRPDSPCQMEGGVVESCMCGCEAKHVRECNGRFGKCTRGFVRGSPYQPCYRCPDRTVDGVVVGTVRVGLTPVEYPPADD